MLDSSIFSHVDRRQLADYRKDVRSNILQREPFAVRPEKQNIILGSWGKTERPKLDLSAARKSPNVSRIQGGLNFEEIFQNKKNAIQPKSVTYSQRKDFDKLLFNPAKFDSYFDNSFASITRPQQKLNTQRSGYKESPNKSQQKLERFKNWDDKLEVQLKLQNKSISSKVLGEKPSFYQYLNESKKGLFEQDWLTVKSNKNTANDYGSKKQPYTFNDTFNLNPQNIYSRNKSSQETNRYAEKFPVTDLVRMTSHFIGLSTQEITTVSKAYISELFNLQQAIQRVIKVSNQSY